MTQLVESAEAGFTAPERVRSPRAAGPLLPAAVGVLLWVGTAISMSLLDRDPAAEVAVIAVIWLNITLMLLALSAEIRRRPYSLHAIHLIALFLFLGAPSLFQYTVGEFAVAGRIEEFRRDTPVAVFAVLLWIVGYVGAYELHHAFARPERRGPVARFLSREISSTRAVFTLVLAVLVLVYLGAVVGLAGVTTRAGAREAAAGFTLEQGVGSGLAFYLINHLLLRAFPLVALAAGLLVLRRKNLPSRWFVTLLVVTVAVGVYLADNPFAGARIWLVTAMFAVAAPWVFARMRTGWAVVAMSIAGLTILPALSHIRDVASFEASVDILRRAGLTSPLDYLAYSTDPDSLGMLVLCVRWTTFFGHQWGLQIASGLLAWFPRYLWPGKGVGTGGMVTGDLGFEFTNLASPIVAEPLVDFGLPGVMLVAALLAIVFSNLDRAYWSPGPAPEATTRIIDVVLPFWLGLVIVFVRGDLMTADVFILAFTFWVLPLGIGGSTRRRASPLDVDAPWGLGASRDPAHTRERAAERDSAALRSE